MRAAVCEQAGAPLIVETLALAEPGPGQLRVKIRACAICHSDVAYAKGAWGDFDPTVFGHEASGVVEAVGPGVTRARPGDFVVVTLIRSCGACVDCASGAPARCQESVSDSPLRRPDGGVIGQGMNAGAFAEFAVVHQSQVAVAPPGVPAESAAVVACAVLTGVGAVVNTAQLRPGASVGVIGAGGVGVNAVQAARIVGADLVLAVDVSDEKLDAARRFGATHTARADIEDVADYARALTKGRGLDAVLVTVSLSAAVGQAMGLVGPGGQVVLVGMPPNGSLSEVDPTDVAAREIRLVGSKMGSARVERDVPKILAWYAQGRLKLDELIDGRFPLDGVNDAIAAATAPTAGVRQLLVMDL